MKDAGIGSTFPTVTFFHTVAAARGLVRGKIALFPSTAFVIDVFGGTVFTLVTVIIISDITGSITPIRIEW